MYSKEDILNAVRTLLISRNIKLFPNKQHKKYVNYEWVNIKDSGLPPNSPNLIGWNAETGKFTAVTVLDINENISTKQKIFLDLMLKDNCDLYTAKEIKYENIELVNWKTNEREIIYVN